MKKNLPKLITLIILLILATWILSAIFNKQDTVTIGSHVFDVDIVRSEKDVTKGLSGKKSIDDNQAMLFLFNNKQERSFWMKDMRFNIDLLWIDGNDIVGYEKNMQAPAENISDNQLETYHSEKKVDKVLEMNAGLIDSLGIEIGDKIKIN